MALYLTKLVNGQVQKLRVSPTKALYRGYWAVIVGGFAGTSVTCNGVTKFIGSSERVAFNIITPGTYTFTATRQGTTITKEVTLDDDTQEYIINLSMFIGMQQLEYIESTGTQYIDTGIVPTETTVIDIVIGKNTSIEKNTNGIFGNDNVGARWNGLNEFRSGFGTSSWTSVTVSQQDKNHIIYEKTNPTFNDTSISISRGTVYGEETLYLYRTTSSYSSTKIYSCKIYDDGTLVRDFIPVKDDTGHGAMYDKVTQQIFYNSGTGDFICGPNKSYTRIQYIESTGTQWIDTGIIYSDVLNARLRLDAIMLDSSASARGIGRSGSYFGGPFVGLQTDGFFGYSAGVDDQRTGVTGSPNERYKYDLNIPASTYVVKDGNNNVLVNVTNIMKSTRSETPSCILFGYYGNPNTGDGPYKLRSMKIYSSQFYDNDTLVRDFVPVLNYDGVPCMLDQVEGKLYYNQGTGQFIAGPEKQ